MPRLDENNAAIHNEHQDYIKIVQKFTGMCLNNSPLKHGEILALDRLDPKTFLKVQFKTFGQQSDFTKQAFHFCMRKNEAVNEEAMTLCSQMRQPAKKKKIWHPKGRVGDSNGDDPDYTPWGPRNFDASHINWSHELDNSQILSLDAFQDAMEKDLTVSDELSITMVDDVRPSDSVAAPDEALFDDFGGNSLSHADIERQLLENLPPDLRQTFTKSLFPQNQLLLDNNVTQFGLDIPVIDQIRISPGRDAVVPGGQNVSVMSDENLMQSITEPQLRKRFSKSPRQPFGVMNDTNEIPVVLPHSPTIRAADAIHVPVVEPVNDEIQPLVMPEVAQTAPEVPFMRILLPDDEPEEVPVPAPVPRVRRPRIEPTLEEHEVAIHRHLRDKRYRAPHLFDLDHEETDLHIPVEPEEFLAELQITDQVANMHLRDTLDEFLAPPEQKSIVQDQKLILRPSTSTVKEPIPRRTSTIRDQIQNSSLPLMPTLETVFIEQQQHLDSAVINTQIVNNNLTEIQRSLGRTPERIRINEMPFTYEVPTMEQMRQIEDARMSLQLQPMLQKFPEHILRGNDEQLAYTESEKGLLEMFFDILMWKVLTDNSEFALVDVVGEGRGRAKKIGTLMKLSWENPKVIEITKKADINIATHVQLIGY